MSEPLATPEALADLIGDDVDPTDAQLPRALAIASAYIRSEAQQDFTTVTDELVTRVGSGTSLLLLPHTPVTGITTVLVRGLLEADFTELASTAWTWDDKGRLNRIDGGTWSGTIAVTYSHGHATVPEEIESACLTIAKRLIVYGQRYGDQQVQDPAAQVSVGLTRLERHAIGHYRTVRVG